MSDTFDARAELEVRLNGIRELLNDLENAKDGVSDLDQVQAKWNKRLGETKKEISSTDRELKRLSGTAKGAKGDLGVDRSDLSEWDTLSDKIKRAELEYKGLARQAAASGGAAPDAKKFLAGQGISAADVQAYQKGGSVNLLKDAGFADAQAALPRLRYALYDVATTAGIASAAITGVGVASVAAYASMESSFTAVERTSGATGDEVEKLRSELVGLTREIPQAFGEIADIAARGAQLGIAKDELADFTETVAQFVATSDTVSLDQAVEAFGRISNLMGDKDFTALGSAITLVGVNAAATEGQIVKTTQELAPFATAVGMSSDEVIGLAAAVASLGQPPERARSAFLTLQRVMDTAVSEGSENLESFATLLGKTAEETAKLWKQDPAQFTSAFASALGSAKDLTATFSDLGINERRAVQVFQALAADARNAGEGMSVLDQAFADANQGYSEGTELARQYALIIDDLASRWQIFLNAVQEAGAAVGATLAPAIGVVLNLLTLMAQGLAAITENPIGAWVTGIAAGIGVIVAAIAGFLSMSALAVASMAAMKTAMAELTITSGAGALGLRTLGAAASQVGAAMGFSAGAIRTFKVALASTGIGLAVVALGTLAAGLWDAANASGELSAELKPVAESLERAIQVDTATFEKTGEAIAVATRELKNNAPAADQAATAARNYANSQSDAQGDVESATKAIQEQTVALGANAEAVLRKHLADDSGFKTLANDAQLRRDAEAIGFTVDQLITEALSHAGGATAYLESIRAKADAIREALPEDQFDWTEADYSAAQYADSLNNVIGILTPVSGEIDQLRTSALESGEATEYAGLAASGAAEDFDEMSVGAGGAAKSMWEAEQAALGVESKLYSLGSAVGENVGAWDVYSEAGRANLGALYATLDAIAAATPGNTSAIASNFNALYRALIEGGFATEQQLAGVQARIQALAGAGAVIGAPTRDFTSFFNGLQAGATKAARAIGGGGRGGGGGVTKAIRTLVDYANDLSGVFKRAFDLRFGNQQGLDSITSGWRKIAEESADAREEMAKYRATLAELGADKQIKQYWLMVAENYGDQLRAAKIRAELADLDNDQAKAQKDLSKAQDKANKTLTGNSDAAIENRSTILDMVGSYQDLLKTYAANGMSQADLQKKAAQLKAEFIQQATQMGYNRTEVLKYASSFDDMATAIQRIPRKITVGFNPNPALQALAEFEAKAKAAGAKAGKAYGGAFGGAAQSGIGTIKPSTSSASVWKNLGYKNGQAMREGIINGISVIKIGNRYITAPGADLYGYAGGGYTGGGGVNDVAGVVHGQEYVMSAPAVRTLGVNGMNYLHQMLNAGKVPQMGTGASRGGMTELSPVDRSLLMEIVGAIRSGLVLDTRQLQAVMNGANANVAQRRRA